MMAAVQQQQDTSSLNNLCHCIIFTIKFQQTTASISSPQLLVCINYSSIKNWTAFVYSTLHELPQNRPEQSMLQFLLIRLFMISQHYCRLPVVSNDNSQYNQHMCISHTYLRTLIHWSYCNISNANHVVKLNAVQRSGHFYNLYR